MDASSLKRVGAVATAFALIFSSFSFIPSNQASATGAPAVSSTVPAAKITFSFDDGLTSAYTNAAPILAQYGYTATENAPTGCINDATATSQCAINESNASGAYMTLTQLKALQSQYGWEIADHTENHPLLSTVSASQLVTELAGSKATLEADGFNPISFATPFGDYNNAVLAGIAQNFADHRGFADQGLNTFPYNDYLIYDEQVQGTVTVAQVESWIQTAVANKQWLVLTFHDVLPNASTANDEYQWSTADLAAVAAYVHSINLPVVTTAQGIATSSTNMLPNSSFSDGIADGWTTDDPTDITLNTQGNGSYPNPTNSIELKGTTKNIHLFSPKVAVDPTQTYVVKNFLNQQAVTSGETAFYIDEYNSAGTWISGQLKSGETTAFVENMNFTYTPSSSAVAFASLQVIVTANSGITAYFANPQMFPEVPSTTTPTPTATPTVTGSVTPTPTVTPTPIAGTNLMPNSDFEDGIADGWTTDDPTDITADAGGNGGGPNPQTSVKLSASTTATTNGHLFSPKISVSNANTYTISSFLNLKTITSGVLAYYIDEYNSTGTWVSGQYITGEAAPMDGMVTFNYTPSSTNVASASLQVILEPKTGTLAYLNDLDWSQVTPITPTPTPTTTVTPTTTPSVTPTPTSTNLMTNGNFNSGISEGWTTDDATDITADSANNGGGSNPTYSAKFVASTTLATNSHLFSPLVAVSSTHTYTISSYLNLKTITSGVFAYYVDEYNASGTWISGKYITGEAAPMTGMVTFTYTPSSASVVTASLQLILEPKTGTLAYLNDINWTQN